MREQLTSCVGQLNEKNMQLLLDAAALLADNKTADAFAADITAALEKGGYKSVVSVISRYKGKGARQ